MVNPISTILVGANFTSIFKCNVDFNAYAVYFQNDKVIKIFARSHSCSVCLTYDFDTFFLQMNFHI